MLDIPSTSNYRFRGQWIEFVIITAYYFWVSWAVSKATKILATSIIGIESKLMAGAMELDGRNKIRQIDRVSQEDRTGNLVKAPIEILEASYTRPTKLRKVWWNPAIAGEMLDQKEVKYRLTGLTILLCIISWLT